MLKEGEADLKSKAAKAAISETVKEPGCIHYYLTQQSDNPLHYVLVERWQSEEALKVHSATPHVKKLLETLGALKLNPRLFRTHEIIFWLVCFSAVCLFVSVSDVFAGLFSEGTLPPSTFV